MSNKVTKSSFAKQFPNGIDLHDPKVQKDLEAPKFKRVKPKLEALANKEGHISAEKLDSVFSLIDSFDKDGSRSSIQNKGSAGQLLRALKQGAKRTLKAKPTRDSQSMTAASSKPRSQAQTPMKPNSATQSPESLSVGMASQAIVESQGPKAAPVSEPISTERHGRILKAQGKFIAEKMKSYQSGPLKDFRDLLSSQAYMKQNPDDFSIEEKGAIRERLRAIQQNPFFQKELTHVKKQFLKENPGIQSEVQKLKQFLTSPAIDQLQSQAEAKAGPNDAPNVYMEQLGLLGTLDTDAAKEMKDEVANKAVENLKRKNPEGFLRLQKTMMVQGLLKEVGSLPPKEQAEVRALVKEVDSAFDDAIASTNLVATNLDRTGGEVLDKFARKVASKLSRTGNQVGHAAGSKASTLLEKLTSSVEKSRLNTWDTKLENVLGSLSESVSPRASKFLSDNVRHLGSAKFKGGMMLLSGLAISGSNNHFETTLNSLSAVDHGANMFRLLTEGAEEGTRLASLGSKAASTAKVLGPLVSVLTSGYDAYNAYGDFSEGDIGGGVGKSLQAAGGIALAVPGIGWATGALMLGGGMAVDWLFGENSSETSVRQLMERRLESFSEKSVPPAGYSEGDKSRFQEAKELHSQALDKIGRLRNGFNILQASNRLRAILTEGSGVGSDDDFQEMLQYFNKNGNMPSFSADALETIERNLYQLRDLNEQLDKLL